MDHMAPRDVYIKLTDPTGKADPVINHHRVWCGVEEFIGNQRRQYTITANPDEIRLVSEATKAEYKAARQH